MDGMVSKVCNMRLNDDCMGWNNEMIEDEVGWWLMIDGKMNDKLKLNWCNRWRLFEI